MSGDDDVTPAQIFHHTLPLNLGHVNDTSNTVTRFHILESLIDIFKVLVVGDEFVDPKCAVEVV